jgi:hypothetical protein
MKKALNNPWVAGGLVLLAIVTITGTLRDGAGGASRPALRGVDPVLSDLHESEEDEAGKVHDLTPAAVRRLVLALEVPSELPDPFASRRARAAVAEETREYVETDRFRLAAVWNQGGGIYLLVNDRVVRPGDRFGRVVVESADLDGAWLTHANGRDFVALGGEFTLVTRSNLPAPTNPDVASHEH